MDSSKRTLGLLAGFVSMLIFAGQFVVARHGLREGLGPYDLVALRFGVAAILLIPLFVRFDWRTLGGVGWRRSIILTLLAGAPFTCVLMLGMQFAPVAHASVINPGLVLIVGSLLGWFWLGEQRTWFKIAGIATAAVGLALVGWDSFSAAGGEAWKGDAIFLISGNCWALYTVFTRRWNVDPLRSIMILALLSLPYLPIYWFFLSPKLFIAAPTEVLLQGFYQGVAHSIVAMLLFSYAVRHIGSAGTSMLSPMAPVLAAVLAIPFLGEIPSLLQWVGIALVAIGMAVSALRRGTRVAPPIPPVA